MPLLGELDPERLRGIRGLILDVDGVLTPGTITYCDDGRELKTFDAKDGAGVKYWLRAGHGAGLLTGRSSPVAVRRAEEMGIREVIQGAKRKGPALLELLQRLGLQPEETAYVGDDLIDIPPMRQVALGIAVADAVPETQAAADAVTERPGGRGAVREVVECLLKAQGLWDGILARYFESDGSELALS